MATKKKLLQAAAGSAGGGGLNVEEVFSTYLYTGNGTDNRAINNGIDLSGEGGMVWIKNRDFAFDHLIGDTERGITKGIKPNNTVPENNFSDRIKTVTSTGFTLGTADDVNSSNTGYTGSLMDYASWTFRKAPKFFDVVTYTGNGTSQYINHNLGCEVGAIFIKRTDATANWSVYHRGQDATAPEDYYMILNLTDEASNNDGFWLDTAPTTTNFRVGNDNTVNASGGTYVAYLFAHNDGDGEFGPDGDADIIKCGSWTTAGTGSPEVNLGFEPQWIMFKRTDGTGDWRIYDTMRGWLGSDQASNAQWLKPNTSAAESTLSNSLYVTPTGFVSTGIGSGTDYIYIAIRRGPMAVPESATEVFAIDTKNSSGDNTDPTWDLGIVTDMAMLKFNKTTSTPPRITSRLTGTQYLFTSDTSAETSNSGMEYDYMTGVGTGNASTTDVNDIVWGWKRAPSYFDVVAYTGDGTSVRNITHNLGVEPEMIWFKVRTDVDNWQVYHKDVGADKASFLDNANAAQTWGFMNNTAPTSSVFTTTSGYINTASSTYIAYLFASLAGVSKVGSYTGNGSSQTIDCGFSSGARFVLIKRTDNISSWFVFDTTRGIVSGNDKLLFLDTPSAEETAYDNIDPDSSGFIINNTGWGENASGGTYIFYAIA